MGSHARLPDRLQRILAHRAGHLGLLRAGRRRVRVPRGPEAHDSVHRSDLLRRLSRTYPHPVGPPARRRHRARGGQGQGRGQRHLEHDVGGRRLARVPARWPPRPRSREPARADDRLRRPLPGHLRVHARPARLHEEGRVACEAGRRGGRGRLRQHTAGFRLRRRPPRRGRRCSLRASQPAAPEGARAWRLIGTRPSREDVERPALSWAPPIFLRGQSASPEGLGSDSGAPFGEGEESRPWDF
mmetsp:Transcript_131754/g.357774  ORF Transcript_131754/g.357774 Transcript_131754/m.357774 type:complete len:243 (-) Transcript_131754:25-753(-)